LPVFKKKENNSNKDNCVYRICAKTFFGFLNSV